jgi:hypothetical protein
MALNNPGDLFPDPTGTQQVCSELSVHDGMGRPPPDVVEHRTFTHQINPYKGIMGCIPERYIPYCPAMSDYLLAASCFMQQNLAGFILLVLHDPVTF